MRGHVNWYKVCLQGIISCLGTAPAGFMKPTRLSPTSHHWPQKTGCKATKLFALFVRPPLFPSISIPSSMTPPSLKKMHQFALGCISTMACTQSNLNPSPDLSSSSENNVLITDSPIFFFAYLLHETRPPLHQMDSWEILSRSSCLSFVYFLPLNLHSTWSKVELFPVMSRPQKIKVYRKEHVHPLPIFAHLLYLHVHVTLFSISMMVTLQTLKRSQPF